MRTVERLLRVGSVSCAVAIITGLTFDARPVDAQTTTRNINDANFKGTESVTTSTGGRTESTTTTRHGERIIDKNHSHLEDDVITQLRTSDEHYRPVSDSFTWSYRSTTTDHPPRLVEAETGTGVTTYNAVGGSSTTSDTTTEWGHEPDAVRSVSRTHEEWHKDADLTVVSATRSVTVELSGGGQPSTTTTTNFRWNAATDAWENTEGVSQTPVQPVTTTVSNPNERVVVPPVSGPSGEIMVTYRDPDHSDHSTAYVAERKQDGSTIYLRGTTDDAHHLYVVVPRDAVSISVFKSFTADGKPDAHAATCTVSADAPVPGTDSVPGQPASATQPGIVRASGAYDLQSGTVTVQTQHTDVTDTLVLDGAAPLTMLAASNRSVVASLPNATAVGRHALTLEPPTWESLTTPAGPYTAVAFDVISLTVDPMPPVENVGDTATATVHVVGLPEGDRAEMDFAIGGSAEIITGGTTATVPVVGGIASCTIRGVRSGQAVVRFHLRVVNLKPS